ncbi:isopeptide-forming domain-containing fimbrial protein [Pseudolactococcus paracarnosus]
MKKIKLMLVTFIAVLTVIIGGKALAYDVTVSDANTGHTYESEQVFSGSLSDDGTTLSNIQWGTGVTEAGKTAIETDYHVNSAQELAEKMTKFSAADAEAFAAEVGNYLQKPAGLSGLEAGYYLIKDKDGTLDHADKAYTSYILKLVKNEKVTPKSDVPTVTKKVKDTNDTTGVTTDWQDAADYDINDKVPFQLTATLPSNLASYKEYSLELKDTLSSGLTYNKDAKIYLVNGINKADVTALFTVADDGSSFKINNLKSIDGVLSSSKIVVEYSAKLNENAVVGVEGNPNEVSLVYSNNPNFTGNGETSPKGDTPKDKVRVFTYQVVVNKVDQDGNPLKGAGFTLYKKDISGVWHTVKVLNSGDATTFAFKGLDD